MRQRRSSHPCAPTTVRRSVCSERKYPFSVRAAETSGRGKSIYAHDKNGKVAAAYHALTKEVLEIERKNEKFRDDAAR